MQLYELSHSEEHRNRMQIKPDDNSGNAGQQRCSERPQKSSANRQCRTGSSVGWYDNKMTTIQMTRHECQMAGWQCQSTSSIHETNSICWRNLNACQKCFARHQSPFFVFWRQHSLYGKCRSTKCLCRLKAPTDWAYHKTIMTFGLVDQDNTAQEVYIRIQQQNSVKLI